MIAPLTYRRMESVGETVEALAFLGPDARVLAGGTDLLVALRQAGESVEPMLLDIGALPALGGIREKARDLVLGPLATFGEICRSATVRRFAAPLAEAARRMGNPQVRNRATLGGNVCNASPCADSIPPLLVLEARLRFVSRGEDRWRTVEETIDGPYSTTVGPESLLTEIVLPKLPPSARGSYVRLARRRGAAKARMAVAVVLVPGPDRTLADVRIGCGSVTPRPHRMRRAERVLVGERPTEETLSACAAEVSAEMVDETGVRWSTEYKRPVIKALTLRALRQAAGLAPGK